jgi:hypothetical protein
MTLRENFSFAITLFGFRADTGPRVGEAIEHPIFHLHLTSGPLAEAV